jgi:OOP family OmpA-OmpF porin
MRLRAVVALTLSLSAPLVLAEERVGDTYVIPQAGYSWLDSDRNADDDWVGGVVLGRHFSKALSLELAASRGSFNFPDSSDLDLEAYSIDALHIFARDARVSPFISIGAGALHNGPDRGEGHTHLLGQAGLGLFIQLAEKGNGASKFGLRPEVKARWSFPNNNEPQDKYLDYVALLGFQFSFGDARPAPVAPVAPEPPPPPPPPPAPPPPQDSDGDGVFDDRDRCPDTPRGVAVDQDGCPRRGSATLQGVNFEYNSALLTGESRPTLNEVATDMKRYPRLQIQLQGHTDNRGSDAYNLKLSQERAQSVREYLITQGVGAQQLTAKGYGESQPTANNSTDAGRAENRRVVMQVLSNPGDVKVEIEPPPESK